ncbi:MAG: FHA domain-containing protein [Rubellimicrobium sp.]|nr:FHA domain-containing protein [Rubellimicrobium sp.]
MINLQGLFQSPPAGKDDAGAQAGAGPGAQSRPAAVEEPLDPAQAARAALASVAALPEGTADGSDRAGHHVAGHVHHIGASGDAAAPTHPPSSRSPTAAMPAGRTSVNEAGLPEDQVDPWRSSGDGVQDPVPEVDLSAMAARLQAQAAPQTGRVRTRFLGFGTAPSVAVDPIASLSAAAAADPEPVPTPAGQIRFPTGWIVVLRGPGRGASFTLGPGVTQIGRGEDQGVRLDFGDASISRSNHAAIAYDEEARRFFIGHGGKANLVRRNDRPVLATEALDDRDVIRIGETTLLFVALCGSGFDWRTEAGDA